MKKNNKYLRTVAVVIILASLGLLYYYYLENRQPASDATQQSAGDSELAALTTRDIENNYPQSPKEVVKYFARIQKACYKTELTDEQVEALAKKARVLFDEELRRTQTDEAYLKALHEEIDKYNSLNRYITDIRFEDAENVEYITFKDRKYASIKVLYTIREGTGLSRSYTRFMLRQDDLGRWKLLYWELAGTPEE